MEYTFEGPRLTDGHRPSPSPFTGASVEGIRTGEADRDEDGQVSSDELYNYVVRTGRLAAGQAGPMPWFGH